MFKRQIAFILILTLVTSSFSRFFIYAGFELNRDYISSTLCENIDMPELHCNGQCYLAKKIQQAQEKEKNNTQDQKKGNYQEAFITQKVVRSEEHTSELQSLMRISYAVFCLKKKKHKYITITYAKNTIKYKNK